MPQFKPYPNAFDLTTDHHQVPPEIVDDPAQLKHWGEQALAAAIEAAKVKQLAGIERSRHMKQARKKQKDEEVIRLACSVSVSAASASSGASARTGSEHVMPRHT